MRVAEVNESNLFLAGRHAPKLLIMVCSGRLCSAAIGWLAYVVCERFVIVRIFRPSTPAHVAN